MHHDICSTMTPEQVSWIGTLMANWQ